ncbi:DUF4145 domain-containing protein [Deinococcus sp.]|uniref:DUF4145 domain-containing protein n=1 Tax=Deinococcus sp. TaxID=47478 RepID=UPI003CC5CA9E
MHCPHCHIHTSITPVFTIDGSQADIRDRFNMPWSVGSCNNCFGLVLVGNAGGTIWPQPLPSDTPKEIPQDIRGNLIEAKMCASISAWRASGTMCRRAIQMASLERGAPLNKTLVEQIKFIKDAGIITNDIHEWATIVRWVGNGGAHPGGVEAGKENAEVMLELTEQFLYVLYVAPAKAATHRAKIGK